MGLNNCGQLGDGTTTNRVTPVQVSGLSNVVSIAGGENHSLALKSDGTASVWGENYFGQLGDGTTTQRLTPVQANIVFYDHTPPITTLETSPTAADGTNGWFKTVPTITLSSNKPGYTKYQWDSTSTAGWLTYSPGSITVSQGQHILYCYSVDNNGNVENAHSQQINVDSNPPSVPTLSSPADGGYTAVQNPTLSWTSSTDASSGMASYVVKIDGAVDQTVASSATSTQTVATLSEGPHSWQVVAVDAAGNTSISATRTVNVDLTNPIATITSPTNGASVSGSVPIIGTASDTNFSNYVLDYGAGSTPSTWTTITSSTTHVTSSILGSLNTATLTNGLYTVRLTANDAVGRTSLTQLQINVNNNTTPPTTTLETSPTAADGTNGWFKTTSIITLSSNRLGATYFKWNSETTQTYSDPFAAREGTNVLNFWSVDNSSNIEATQHRTLYVDTQAPSTPANPRATVISGTQINLSWDASTDNVGGSGVAGYYIYNAATDATITATSNTTFSHTSLAPDSPHTYYVRAYDAAGNLSGRSATASARTYNGVVITSSGNNIDVILGNNVSLGFSNITSAGTTAVTLMTTPPAAPSGFTAVGNYFDITTTASFSGYILVTVPYDPNLVSNPKLFHWNGTSWQDVTYSFDRAAGTITGRVTSLSPFVVVSPSSSSSSSVPASSACSLILMGVAGIFMLARRILKAKQI